VIKPTTFQTVPQSDQLSEVPRDLRFHPVTNPAPNVLSSRQLDRFNRDGYLKPLCIFEPDEIADIRSYFDRLLARYAADGKDSYSISSAHLRHGRVWDLLAHPRIVALVSDLLGPSVIGWGSHFFCKMPGDGKRVAWHQDASYWPLTPSKAVTVWLAIDDADPANANMRFIVGTHLLGHLTYQLSEHDESNVLNQTIPEIEKYGAPIDVELKAGEASIHSDLLLHGSEPNTSDRRRCGLTLRYSSGDVHAYLGWADKGVVAAGEKPEHWADRPRPAEE
jgi:ectoine hydroxylase-related dioxygenase (phytanoyl-CoA dioxygenase family)